jgi:hypothetical protein
MLWTGVVFEAGDLLAKKQAFASVTAADEDLDDHLMADADTVQRSAVEPWTDEDFQQQAACWTGAPLAARGGTRARRSVQRQYRQGGWCDDCQQGWLRMQFRRAARQGCPAGAPLPLRTQAERIR